MSQAKIGILNYNTGNLHSVQNALHKIGANAEIFNTPEQMASFDKLLLPGVGSFGVAMDHLREYNLIESILEFAQSGKYILGICLGSQILFEQGSEFGTHKGLGLIEGEVVAFDPTKMQDNQSTNLKIPHMGWNTLHAKKDPLFTGLDDEVYCYFVHSFHMKCAEKHTLATTKYGYEFASAVKKDNIYGFQPHPEKSHDNGLKILENFANLR